MTSVPLLPACIEGNKDPINVGIGAVFLTLSAVLTILRVYVRTRRITAGLGWDDACIILATILAIPLYAVTVMHTKNGLGRHIGCLSFTELLNANKYRAISRVPVMISTLFSRVSICLSLLRVFAVNVEWRWILYCVIGLTAATNISCAPAILLQCHPRAKMWNPTLPGTCWSQTIEIAIAQIQGAISAFLDLVLSGLPIYCMWKIQMSWRIKAAICGLMSLGVFTAGCVLTRIIVLGQISGMDVTWDSALPSLMGDLEVYVSIIVANIPTIRPLFTRKLRKPAKDLDQFGSSEARLKHTKFTGASDGLDPYNAGSYTTETTTNRSRDGEVSLEQMGGIKKVVDVKVSLGRI